MKILTSCSEFIIPKHGFYRLLPKFLIIFLSIVFISCKSKTPLFVVLKADKTNIKFENKLTETEQLNILSYEYFYNGGGVAAGDFNNDGLTDLYFSGNQVPNKLYLNEGDLKFSEINGNVEGKNSWKTGVAVVDINNDGWLDIYQCYSGIGSDESRKNQLFINQGSNGKEWSGKFVEEAEKYGIADSGYSTHATFFDYDSDGDLDLFVLNHNLKNYQRKEAAVMKSSIDHLAGDRLYRNDNQHFIDVTLQAGIKSNPLGFGLGVVVSDFNQDNYPDLYVANDYVEEDYLYINNGNGTFDEVGKKAIGHFSYSSMGVDAADVNNDGLTDIFTADMLPEDNARQKLLAFPDNWNVQKSMLENGFHWQNMRNMLQINQGAISNNRPKASNKMASSTSKNSKSSSIPYFSEVGQLAGIAATDWSWSPLFADFDNDGFKDLFVSNGFVRDLTDLDFVKYYLDQDTKSNQKQTTVSLLEMVSKMPSTPTHHFIFKNNGNLTFTNQVKEWGFEENTIACGSIYADLDNDGDLEIITNNTNSTVSIYKNTQQETSPKNFLRIRLDPQKSKGAKVWIYTNHQTQLFENQATHGFQSSFVIPIHVGLGESKQIDSLKIRWSDGTEQKLISPKINAQIDIKYEPSKVSFNAETDVLFSEINLFDFYHQENQFIDFNRQILLPRLYSQVGPKFAKGDVNGDGLEDILITTPQNQLTALYLQKSNGSFFLSSGLKIASPKNSENIDAVFIDVENDNDLDLYIINGGYEQVLEDKINEDELFLNDGKGNFTKSSNKIPTILTNKSCIKVLDYDNDKDSDIFIGGGVRAGLYPYSDASYLLQNDGNGNFSIAQKFEIGLTKDVAVADINQDKLIDLVVVGEFIPIQVLKNMNGKISEKPEILIENSEGWYNRILANDLDNDGDIDFVIGNLGMNTPLQASLEKPLQLYFGDADGNGTVEAFLANYFGDKSHPIAGRDEALEQWIALRKKFTDYKSYSKAAIEDIFDAESLTKVQKQAVYQLKSGILWNESGKFNWQDLPIEAQTAPIYAIEIDDFNHDGKKDILIAGNESGFRIRIGKTDANYGLVLLGNAEKRFQAISQTETGLFLKGDIKDIIKIGKSYIFGINNDNLKSFTFR